MKTKLLENGEFCLFRQFSFNDNRIVQSTHYWTTITNSDIQFFALPSVTLECNPKILELLYLLQCHSIHSQRTLIKVSEKAKYLSCGRAFSFRRCCMHLQSYLMRVGSQILWKKAEPNHQLKSKRLILQFPIVAHSSAWLHLSIQFM